MLNISVDRQIASLKWSEIRNFGSQVLEPRVMRNCLILRDGEVNGLEYRFDEPSDAVVVTVWRRTTTMTTNREEGESGIGGERKQIRPGAAAGRSNR
jgi:hypothetical protein